MNSARIGRPVRQQIAAVTHVNGGYSLPAGLAPGAIVQILDFDHGYHIVEFEGHQFRIFAGCAEIVPSQFYTSKNAKAFFMRIRDIIPTGLHISTEFNHLKFAIFSDDHKPRGSLMIHKDAILNLGPDFAERIGRRLVVMRNSQRFPLNAKSAGIVS